MGRVRGGGDEGGSGGGTKRHEINRKKNFQIILNCIAEGKGLEHNVFFLESLIEIFGA